MNISQELWWQQAKSDHSVFVLLREEGVAQCHLLHYLQMVTEKIAKAYLWRENLPPPKSHAGFVQFLRFLGQIHRSEDCTRVANMFSFNKFTGFKERIRDILPIAYDLQRLAPDLSNDGPNPEYPWPHSSPQIAPTNHSFATWQLLLNSSQGRDLMRIIHLAILKFPEFADI